MTEERNDEQKPWYPKVDREPLFNSFESPQIPTADAPNPVALTDEDFEEVEPAAESPEELRTTASDIPSVTDEPKSRPVRE
jgi:hypothetical protein